MTNYCFGTRYFNECVRFFEKKYLSAGINTIPAHVLSFVIACSFDLHTWLPHLYVDVACVSCALFMRDRTPEPAGVRRTKAQQLGGVTRQRV